MTRPTSRRVPRQFVSMLLLVVLIVGTPATSIAMTTPPNDAVPSGAFTFSAYHDDGFFVSSEPINLGDGRIVESRDPLSVKVSSAGYADAGIVCTPALKLGALRQVALAGEFVNTVGSVLNIWIDTDLDGQIFRYDSTGKLTGVAGDSQGCINLEPVDGVLTVRDATTFYMMLGPDAATNQSLAELKAKYPNAMFSFWIGVNDATESSPQLTIDKLTVNPPSQVIVDPALAGKSGVTADGLIIGVEAFAGLQAGIDGVADGGTVTIAGGATLQEQVVIDKRTLTIDGNGATLTALDNQVGASIWARNDSAVTVKNLTIDGRGVGNPNYRTPDERFFGIYFQEARGTISGNTIIGFHHADGAHGMQTGTGIYIKNWDNVNRTVTVENNTVSDFQKNGITANGVGLNVTIHGNTATGWGPVDIIAQNGVQIGYGAVGLVDFNTISAIDYTKNVSACGVLLYESGVGTVVRDNVIRDSKNGVSGSGAAAGGADILGNAFANVQFPISLSGPTAGALAGNTFTDCANGVSVDVRDVAAVRLNETDLSSLHDIAVENASDGGILDATHNYWGDGGPTDRYAGLVNVYPYYLNPELTQLIQSVSGIVVDDDFVGLADGTDLTVNGQWATIGTNAFSSVAAAVKVAHDGDTISVYPGSYPLMADTNWTVTAGGAGGQGGWYLPIVQNNLTIQGVNEAGVPYAVMPTKTSPLPTIYGNDYTPNGSWASQNLVTVFGAGVKLTGLAFMPKTEVNKTIEITGANPTVKYCRFEPNTRFTQAGYDFTTDGGCLYISGGLIGSGASNTELTDNYYLKSGVIFDSMTNAGTNRVARSTFDTPWSYLDGSTTVYGYMIGNTTWTNPQTLTFSGALVEENTFLNYPTTAGYSLIKNRLNGRFTLRANRVGGQDGAELIQIATASFGCLDGTVLIESWVNSSNLLVHENILVDRFGIHREPSNPPEGGGGNGGGGGTQPPIVAGSTSEVITVAGGTVNHEDTVVVTIPANAVSTDVTVTIAPIVENVPSTTGMIMIGSHVYDITAETADGTTIATFAAPVTIAITLTDEELAEITASGTSPYLNYWDSRYSRWIALPTVLDGGVLTATTSHFATFAAAGNTQLPTLADIKGNWAEAYILRLAGLGIASGRPDHTFGPKAGLTRTEAAKLLANTLGLQADETYALTFVDAASIPAWGKGYVAAVAKAGLMKGDDLHRFHPEGILTRAEFAVMVARALNLPIDADAVTTFLDDAQIPGWAKGHIAAAVKAGIIDGLPGNTYGAAQSCNREQAAKMLCKLIDLLQ